METYDNSKLPPRILPGSDKWPSHLQRMRDLHMNGILLVRKDSKLTHRNTLALKIEQPVEGQMKVKSWEDGDTFNCPLEDLEIVNKFNFTLNLADGIVSVNKDVNPLSTSDIEPHRR